VYKFVWNPAYLDGIQRSVCGCWISHIEQVVFLVNA